jgi:hypothetical protein
MRRRKLLVVLTGLTALGIGVFLLRPAPYLGITQEDFDRVQIDMTAAETEAILGPPGDYRTMDSTPTYTYRLTLSGRISAENRSKVWWSDRGGVVAFFDESGKLCGKGYMPADAVTKIHKGPLGNFLWRVKRQLRWWFQ